MSQEISPGDCVKIPDDRIGRVRSTFDGIYRVRVRRISSQTHQFLEFHKQDLVRVTCPQGWMSPEGYNRYLKITLEKMRARNQSKRANRG